MYIYASAGMRVLSESDQNAIYDTIFKSYLRSDIQYYMNRDMLRTISGISLHLFFFQMIVFVTKRSIVLWNRLLIRVCQNKNLQFNSNS